MGILSDRQIRSLALAGMIEPFEEGKLRPGVISYGLSSMGYDVRIGRNFKVFTNSRGNVVIDPKNFDSRAFEDITADEIFIPPNSFVLGETIEIFRIPRNILCVVMGKSTLARCALIVNVTPGEPEWKGRWTIEVSNTAPLPVKLYAGEGIAQVLFLRSEDPDGCEVSYQDRKGRYQDQAGLTLPTVSR